MFKQAHIAAAAVALTFAAGAAMAQNAERNVFDTETNIRIPATTSAPTVSREQVRAEFMAARAAGDLNLFDTETVAYAPRKSRDTSYIVAQAKK